jgi:hypothetical protein
VRDAQREAAGTGRYWFVRWETGECPLFDTEQEARRALFEDLEGVLASELKRPHSIEVLLFLGHASIGSVRLVSVPKNEVAWYGWSPVEDDSRSDITPEEFAHILLRRRGDRP